MLTALETYLPLIIGVVCIVTVLGLAHWLLIARFPDMGNEQKFPRQLSMLVLTLCAVVALLFLLPIQDSSRNQLIGLLGILISGMLAFSSTTVLSNLMAGLLLRFTKPFQVGDYVRIGEYAGRISERGLFDVEIQTESRELIAVPNTVCISQPVTTVRRSGTIISATLSLGYDVDRRQIETCLMGAATATGLQEPFVHILALNDFSVTYRVAGLLEDAKQLISTRSSLYGQVLDSLHGAGIEIVSPGFMNQRPLTPEQKILPPSQAGKKQETVAPTAETLAFDKAEQAEAQEREKAELTETLQQLQSDVKTASDGEQKQRLQHRVDALKARLEHLNQSIEDSDAAHKTVTTP
ncbi:mechanosensitive ion channel [Aestuariibacter halophilus]|uniref:Small-conductance mechanosensitive channel n=1 Tax=Fluctibacter halophilus TaxID=226011 RepID=A0ABS8G5N3_9ALTE|nr:mechanosensitive ion channel domain-containing protein [Aestuariibacter halophilus]MCC2615897.1 mechanosensitive ion channel [Aestuariibacter halophilus]